MSLPEDFNRKVMPPTAGSQEPTPLQTDAYSLAQSDPRLAAELVRSQQLPSDDSAVGGYELGQPGFSGPSSLQSEAYGWDQMSGASTTGSNGDSVSQPGTFRWGNYPNSVVDSSGGSFTGDPGIAAGNPGAFTGDPGIAASNPGAFAGDPGIAVGNPGAFAGDPGIAASNPGAFTGDPGIAAGNPGAATGDSNVAPSNPPAGNPASVPDKSAPADDASKQEQSNDGNSPWRTAGLIGGTTTAGLGGIALYHKYKNRNADKGSASAAASSEPGVTEAGVTEATSETGEGGRHNIPKQGEQLRLPFEEGAAQLTAEPSATEAGGRHRLPDVPENPLDTAGKGLTDAAEAGKLTTGAEGLTKVAREAGEVLKKAPK